MHCRLRLLLGLAVLLVAAGAPGANATEEVVAPAPGATGLTAYGGHVVWSQPDPATGLWQLEQWHAGHVARLPVAERAVPFDADAGPDARGRPVVVYSRCRHEPAGGSPRGVYFGTGVWSLARGCDIFETSLRSGTSRRLREISTASASETTPSIWRGAIAFARRGPRQHFARVLLHRPGHRRALPLPGGTRYAPWRGQSRPPSGAPDAMDLGPRVLAFVWLVTDSPVAGLDERGWELWLDSRRSSNQLEAATGGSGECDFRGLASPNAVGLGASWLRSTGGCQTPDSPPERSVALAFDWSSHVASQASPEPFAVALARDGATTWLLRAPGFVHPGQPPFVVNPQTCEDASACVLVRANGLHYGPADESVPCSWCGSRRRLIGQRAS
jgi:hypothetical protein